MVKTHIVESENVTMESLQERTIWECMYCKKRFKTCEFISKHIIMKHPQSKDKVRFLLFQHLHYIMQEAYLADPSKITSYQGNREDRENMNRNRRGGPYRRGRGRDYKDLDDPEVMQAQKSNAKSINFLDI